MALLAEAINGKIITVIILCIAAFIFLLIDAFLVISLHRHNSLLAERDSESEEQLTIESVSATDGAPKDENKE